MAEPKTPAGGTDGNHLHRSAELRRERDDRWRAEGERSLGRNLAMIGSLGGLVVTPTLLGVFGGRWLDERFATGIFWTATLIFVGVCLGCWLAWQRILKE